MTEQVIGAKTFTLGEQQAFASLSGDYNPVHLDDLVARRTQAGAPIVHGMHTILWAFDRLARVGIPIANATAMRVRLSKFLYLDTSVELRITRRSALEIKVELVAEGTAITTLSVSFGPAPFASGQIVGSGGAIVPVGVKPNAPSLPELSGLRGVVPFVSDEKIWRRSFPKLADTIPCNRLIALGTISRLVGMISPGLHSIFSGFEISFMREPTGGDFLRFRVDDVDERFRLVKMSIEGGGICGRVEAFGAHPPRDTPSMMTIASSVRPNEFAGCKALVVGASRGLGAVTAKIIAAGGGQLVATYARGRNDAEELCLEVNRSVGSTVSHPLFLDVTNPAFEVSLSTIRDVTHLYYFATPKIFRQASEVFSPSKFQVFLDYYVDGFKAITEAVLTASGRLSVFYPSTTSVLSRPPGMAEYAMAKAAGEILCHEMGRSRPGLSIVVPRLPRVLTDQTATMTPVKSRTPAEVMIPLCRTFHGGGWHQGGKR